MAGSIVFKNKRNENNMQNRNNYYNSSRNSNSAYYSRRDPELELQLIENAPEDVLGEDVVYGICMKALRGEDHLPWYINFSDCYRIFKRYEHKNGSLFPCDWEHGPLSCMTCLRNCIPAGHCTHHSHKH